MAIRGRKPKPAYLKLIAGNPGKRQIVEDVAAEAGAARDNGLVPPRRLKKRQQQLWDQYIRRAPWLKPLDVPRAFMWVELHVQFESDPSGMVAGKIAQLRALGSELGLDPAARARLATNDDGQKPQDPAAKYFS